MRATARRQPTATASRAGGAIQAEPERGWQRRLCRVALIVALLAGFGAALGSPAAFAAPPGPGTEAAARDNFMIALRGDLAALVDSWPGEHAVSVLDVQTGQLVSVNGDRAQLAACSIKIFIMMAVAQDIEAGLYTAASVEDLVLDAMGPSNTPPARELIRIIGGGAIGAGVHRVNAIMRELGAERSILTHPPGYPEEEYGYAASHGIIENLLVADEVAMMLGKLYRGEALSPWATEYVLWSMTLAIPGQQGSLGGPLPYDAQLYHKIGLLFEPENTWNDVGIVTFERGDQTYAYAIAYLGAYAPDWLDAYFHGTSVSAAAWEAFSDYYGAAPPTSECFPQTGQCVDGLFYQYWRDNGGLMQQGLPLSPVFTEINAATGRSYAVQYFERARFELHPENMGTPYVVLLGQVGREQFAEKYPEGAPRRGPAGGVCFPETGYCVRGVFYDYWAANGALAQQGYPIGPEFDEVSAFDGKTYRVQYFERARFEYHPENRPPYDVLLGQLGREQFEARYPGGAPSSTQSRIAVGATTTRARLLTQIAALDELRAALPQGAADDPHRGWETYDRALEAFLTIRPELRAYLLWYYHHTTPGATPGLTYHPDGAALRDVALLERYLATGSTPRHGR
jgi:beta-lactamase class A